MIFVCIGETALGLVGKACGDRLTCYGEWYQKFEVYNSKGKGCEKFATKGSRDLR